MGSYFLDQVQEQQCPRLEDRFSLLKKLIVKPENKQKVIESYSRLLKALVQEVDFIAKLGPKAIPEVHFSDIIANNGHLPQGAVDVIRERGCVIIRGVVPEAQATKWRMDLTDYTQRHSAVSGFPKGNVQNWNLWWTPPQVQIRSDPSVLKAMDAVSALWHVSEELPMDLGTQVVYPDRFRIRYPTTVEEYTLPAHQDTGSTERWEDPTYRSCYEPIFEGRWEDYDPFCADFRPESKTFMYDTDAICSAFRSMQGWISLSNTKTGEGTLRLVPNLKLSTAYLMLRPFFVLDEQFDDTIPTFPGAIPGKSQFFPTNEFHPHLDMKRTMVGIPPVKPGDYVFWHCDLIHEVDRFHPGINDSAVSYNACVPLCPHNVRNLAKVRSCFEAVIPPRDFRGMSSGHEWERDHEDHGARMENILSAAGRRAMGLEPFDISEKGLTPGQREARRYANEVLGFTSPYLGAEADS